MIVELTFVVFVVFGILIISLLLKGKWRKLGWSLSIIFLIGYCIFYFVRPYWIDMQIEKMTVQLEQYLSENYPDESWTITTVPHREKGYETANPYQIFVTFENEPDVTYHYYIKKDTIRQSGYTTDKEERPLLYLESVK